MSEAFVLMLRPLALIDDSLTKVCEELAVIESTFVEMPALFVVTPDALVLMLRMLV